MSKFGAIYLLILRCIATKGRLAALAGLGAFGIFVAFMIDGSVRESAQFVNAFGLTMLVPLAALIFATAALGDLIDDSTMVYLWLRPVRRSVIVLAAYAATLTVVVPLVAIPLAVMATAAGGDAGAVTGAALAGAVGLIAYSAIFLMLGVRVRRSLIWGLLYIFIWEGFVAQASKTASQLAIRAYTRSILSNLALPPPAVPLRLATISTFFSYATPIAVAVVAIAYASRRLQQQDVA